METTKEIGEDSFVSLAPARPPTQAKGTSTDINLVRVFKKMGEDGEALMKKISGTVLSDYDADVKSRSRRMKRIKDFQELYASIMKPKNFPFQNAANVNIPFVTYPSMLVQARLYDMVVPANGKILLCSPTNLGDVERASVTEKFANSYIRHKMPEFATSMDSTLMQLVINGSAFRRTYWNDYEQKVCSDGISVEDFVVAYWVKSDDPSMRDVPRYTLVMHPTLFDLEDYSEQGIYENVDELKAGDAREDRRDEGLRETVKKLDGVDPSDEATDDEKPRMVLEQYRKWRLPDKPKTHPAFDGRAHAVIVTVDEASGKLLRVVVREEDDPDDVVRFDKEMSVFEGYISILEAHQTALTEAADAAVIAQQNGMEIPLEVQALPEAPLPPEGIELDDDGVPVPPRKPRRRPISFFTHYKCSPGEGFYGHGFGDFLAPLARAANTILNQHIDGVTLRNARPAFISKQLRGQRGAVNIQPGEFIEVDAPMGVIKDGIHWLDPPQSDPTTMKLLELIQDMVQKFAGNDVMSGQPSGSNQTARGTMILNENAMAQLSVLSRRVKEAEKHELDKIWRCWGTYLSDEEIQADIVDENGVPGTVAISRALFTPDARVLPAADPRSKSQKVEETTALYTMALQNPLLMQNPMVLQALTEDVLRAMDGNKIIPLMQPQQQEPPPPKKHWEEDAGFLRGEFTKVHPDDDDDDHIAGHQGFMNSPAAGFLDKTGKDMIETHVRNHAAQRLEKAGQQHEQLKAAASGGFGGMAGGPDDAGMGQMAQ